MDKYSKAFERANEFEFAGGYRFDEPDYEALMVTEENYLEQLRVQAAGLAYYGTLAKSAEREYDEMERRYKSRYNEMYAECSDILARAGKNRNQKDVDSFIRCKFESEVEKWEKGLLEARANRDGAMAYYEGWKAKGFALSSMTGMITAGLLSPRTAITSDDVDKAEEKKKSFRSILERK